MATATIPATKQAVTTVEYTRKQLATLLKDEQFWSQPRLPITKRRILSQMSNPRAEENDTLLMTAHHEGKLIAYLGVLPDRIKGSSQEWIKFGWLTAWWADKESKQRLAGMKLLFASMKRNANRLAASSPSSEAAQAYLGSGRFQEHGRCDRSFFILSLPPSLPLAGAAAKWFSGMKNRLIFSREVDRRGLQVQVPDVFNENMEAFLDSQALQDPFGRDSAYWNWVLELPWMSATDEDLIAQKNYQFSVFAKDFRQIPMFVSRRGETIAFLFMNVRDGRLTLKHAYYDPAEAKDVAAALEAAIAEINPWLFVSGDANLNAQLKSGLPFYVARQARHSAIYAANDLSNAPWCHPQPGTGDSVFT